MIASTLPAFFGLRQTERATKAPQTLLNSCARTIGPLIAPFGFSHWLSECWITPRPRKPSELATKPNPLIDWADAFVAILSPRPLSTHDLQAWNAEMDQNPVRLEETGDLRMFDLCNYAWWAPICRGSIEKYFQNPRQQVLETARPNGSGKRSAKSRCCGTTTIDKRGHRQYDAANRS